IAAIILFSTMGTSSLVFGYCIIITSLFMAVVFGSNIPTRAFFVFGDSLVDSGNNDFLATSARADTPPYGIDFPTHRPTGRFSNGLNIPDLISQQLGLEPTLPYLSPLLQGEKLLVGANFASAGIGILNDTGFQFLHIIHIYKQLKLFQHYQLRLCAHIGKEAAKKHINNALVLITLGGNDFVNNYYLVPYSARSRQFSLPDYVHYLISEYRPILKRLYYLGARRVLVTGTGPMGCVPAELALRSANGDCDIELQRAAFLYNPQLVEMIKGLNHEIGADVFIAANAYQMHMDFPATMTRDNLYWLSHDQVALFKTFRGTASRCKQTINHAVPRIKQPSSLLYDLYDFLLHLPRKERERKEAGIASAEFMEGERKKLPATMTRDNLYWLSHDQVALFKTFRGTASRCKQTINHAVPRIKQPSSLLYDLYDFLLHFLAKFTFCLVRIKGEFAFNIFFFGLTGFVSSKIACCGQGPYNGIGLCTPISNLCPNRDLYAFWDPFHPSEKANRIIVQQILTGSNQYMHPMNLTTIMALDSRT
ncbi:hypothetical protein Lal_00047652, partial [Lupinus albus]